MPPLALKTAVRTVGHTRPLQDGTVTSDRLVLDHADVSTDVSGGIRDTFDRMVRGLGYDVAQMTMSTYLSSRTFNKPFTAIPVFVVRRLHHGDIFYNIRSGIKSPADLVGKTVGIQGAYSITLSVWVRGILHSDYGVDSNRVTWAVNGKDTVAEYVPPPNVTSLPAGSDLFAILESGDIDAAIGLTEVNSPDIRPLIPDPHNAAIESFKRTGVYPINHTIVIKNELLAAHPWLAKELFSMFTVAKEKYFQAIGHGIRLDARDEALLQVRDMVGGDPIPYGIEPNRKPLETFIQYAVDQKVIPRKFSVHGIVLEPSVVATSSYPCCPASMGHRAGLRERG